MATNGPAFSRGAVADYLQKRFGGRFVERESTVQLSNVTPTLIVGHNAERISVLIVNHDTDAIVVSRSAETTLVRGIRLFASGGSVSLNVREDGTAPAGDWYGLGVLNNADVYVLEVLRDTIERGVE